MRICVNVLIHSRGRVRKQVRPHIYAYYVFRNIRALTFCLHVSVQAYEQRILITRELMRVIRIIIDAHVDAHVSPAVQHTCRTQHAHARTYNSRMAARNVHARHVINPHSRARLKD